MPYQKYNTKKDIEKALKSDTIDLKTRKSLEEQLKIMNTPPSPMSQVPSFGEYRWNEVIKPTTAPPLTDDYKKVSQTNAPRSEKRLPYDAQMVDLQDTYADAPTKTKEPEEITEVPEATSGFKPSQTYLDALAYTNNLLAQLNSGRTSYTDKLNGIMAQIEGRDKFSYDFNTDPMFQSALESAMRNGQLAMQDTMGQAAGLTGGYGSTYAQSVGNQAYNQEIQGAYQNLPEFYGMALDAYNSETQGLLNQLEMYAQADDNEYNRLANAYALNAQNAANIYDMEYNNYYREEANKQNAAELEYQREKDASDMAYKMMRDSQDDYFKQMEMMGKYGLTSDENGNIVQSQNTSNEPNYKVASDRKNLEEIVKAFQSSAEEGEYMWNMYAPNMTDDDMDYIEKYLKDHELGEYSTKNKDKKYYKNKNK